MLLGPGLGLVPPLRPEKDEEIVAAWSTVAGVELPPALFFVFIGTCKAMGVLAMWDTFGTQLDRVANLCFVSQLLGAAYTHHMIGEPLVPPLVMLSVALARLATTPSGRDARGKGSKAA